MVNLDANIERLMNKLLKDNETGMRQNKVRRQLKNKYFRLQIYKKYNERCAECEKHALEIKAISKKDGKQNYLTIHHKKYNWKCPYIDKPKFNCARCSEKYPGLFKYCFNNCVLLCWKCHYKLHRQMLEDKGKFIDTDENYSFIEELETRIEEVKEEKEAEQKKFSRRQFEGKENYFQRISRIKEKYPNAYEKWDLEQEKQLGRLYRMGKNVTEISMITQRQPSAIKARLRRLELL